MSEGMKYDPESFLKIGFLNDRVERLPQYLEIYDVVVLDDPDFSVPVGVVTAICEVAVTMQQDAVVSDVVSMSESAEENNNLSPE